MIMNQTMQKECTGRYFLCFTNIKFKCHEEYINNTATLLDRNG